MGEEGIVESVLKGATGVLHTEDLVLEAVRDLVKDEIKHYIREKIEQNPELKEELKEAVGELLEAKIKEAYALMKAAKVSAKLGLELVPPHLRAEVTKELLSVFEKELNAIIDTGM